MITKEEIEKTRSPQGLHQFVRRRFNKIRKDRGERHKATQRQGLYKVFTDEIIPLSLATTKLFHLSFCHLMESFTHGNRHP